MPDSTYEITVTVTDANSGKFGFEMVAEDESGDKQGTFTGNTEVTTFINDQRVTHTSGSNTGTGSRTWTVNWKAPSLGQGAITFYVAALIANGNGNNSGDFVVVDSRKFARRSTASSSALSLEELKIYPNPNSDFIQIKGVKGDLQFFLFDMHGKLVLESRAKIIDIGHLPVGYYTAKVIKGNVVRSQKILKR